MLQVWCCQNPESVCPPQHLSTFVLDRKDGMVTVEDGVRRLRLLDAKGKVWTQEMLLQVDDRAVSLADLDTKVGPELWTWSWNPGPSGTRSISF